MNYFDKYNKYKTKYLNLLEKQNNYNYNYNNNIIYGGKIDPIKERKKNTIKIIKSLKSMFKEYNIKRSTYLLIDDTSLFFHNLNDEIIDMKVYCKKIEKKINILKNIDKKYYFNISVKNENLRLDDDLYKKFWLYLNV